MGPSFVSSSLISSFKGKVLIAVLLGVLGFILSWSPIVFPKMGFVMANFAFLPIFLSGFSIGILGGGISAGVFVVISGLMGGMGVSVWSVISMGLVLWIIRQSLLYREKEGIRFFYPEGRLFVFLIVLSIGALVVGILFLKPILLMHMQVFQGLNITSTQEMIFVSLKEYAQQASLSDSMIFQILPILAAYGPALFLSSWILTLFVNAACALSVLKKWGTSLRPQFSMQTIDLPNWYPWMLIASALLIFMEGELEFIGKNASALVVLGFALQGISVFHVYVQNKFEKDTVMPKIMLGFFYTLVILFPWILGILAGIGILEQFMHLRNRIVTGLRNRVRY